MNPYSANFDCIKHINTLFPNEQSLVGIDTEIEKLQSELTQLQSELQEDIHEHAVMQNKIWRDVQDVEQLSQGIVTEIQEIKQKAEKSEDLVYSMCKDIKSLDIAKRNLTFSIAALKKFIMMLTAIEKLKEHCKDKKYAEVANLLSAFTELSQYFVKFQNIPQILEINGEKEQLIKDLKLQLIDDFILFQKGTNLMQIKDLQDACQTVEHLGLKFRDELIQKVCKYIISPYQELFQQIENRSLETTERRYAWMARVIKDFDTKTQNVFPEYWAVHCQIYYEFCAVTRLQITDILESLKDLEVAVLMKALQATLKFEQKLNDEMKKRYDEWLGKKNSNQFAISELPKIKGAISDSFEPYLRPYIDSEERELMQHIQNILNSDKLDVEGDLKMLNSSMSMFAYFKQMLKRASQYSRTQVMFDIQKLIKKALKKYSDEIIMKINQSRNNEQLSQIFCCFVINTAEYCKETIPGLQESLVQHLDSPFSDQVELSNEEEYFNQMMNKSIETLLVYVDSKVDQFYQQMLKIDWNEFENMGDASKYIRDTISFLEGHIKTIKDLLSESYLIFYLNKLVVYLNNKFINSVFRIKKISEIGLSQLMLDVSELKTNLVRISKLKQESKSQQSFNNFVQKTLSRSDSILKLIQMSIEKFVENFPDYAKKYESAPTDLDKILGLKQLRRQDVPQLNKFFTKIN
ncbi:unnamed protein product [Paramecium primaurelia]|uniref:Vps53 N-terminal domain-containing protein n=1 Tax=Paramecium primaurelia TaxID=5886 RepID=A0A8S1MDU3_PARPR|nr:unnamed protein product [Paramecium primaurelia]